MATHKEMLEKYQALNRAQRELTFAILSGDTQKTADLRAEIDGYTPYAVKRERLVKSYNIPYLGRDDSLKGIVNK